VTHFANFATFIPMKSPGRKLLVLDLDETLVHATQAPLDRAADFAFDAFHIYQRPGLHAFFQETSRNYDLAIWSSADDSYVAAIVAGLLPTGLKLQFAWGRSHCWLKTVKMPLGNPADGFFQKRYQQIKPLEKITRMGYKRSDLLIIDDTAAKVEDNHGRHLIVLPYEGSLDDDELPRLAAYLQLSESRSIATHDALGWRNLHG
jgi:carboxy-terminal domain RNA polymerase II polypeptide A small phosphatase